MPGLFTASVTELAAMSAMRNPGILGICCNLRVCASPGNHGGRCCCRSYRDMLALHANLSTSLAAQPQVRDGGLEKAEEIP